MRCIVCAGSSFSKIPLMHEVSRYTHVAHRLYKCKKCGVVRPFPLPYTDKSKNTIYDVPQNIKFYDPSLKGINFEGKEYKYYFKHFKPFLEIIKQYNLSGKTLDIGCGPGHLTILLNKEGFQAEGQDISPNLERFLKKKFKIYCGELNSPALKKNSYSFITLNQVLEHVEDPGKLLKEIRSLLKPEGYLIVAVPYLAGFIPQVMRTYWYGLGYGQHLNFFTKKSAKILFEKNGFSIEEFKILSNDYYHPKFPRFLEPVIDLFCNFLVKLGLGDNLFIIAKRV